MFADINEGESHDFVAFELASDFVLRSLIRQIIVSLLKWDVMIIEEPLCLLAVTSRTFVLKLANQSYTKTS